MVVSTLNEFLKSMRKEFFWLTKAKVEKSANFFPRVVNRILNEMNLSLSVCLDVSESLCVKERGREREDVKVTNAEGLMRSSYST